jgi:hypothetical protein
MSEEIKQEVKPEVKEVNLVDEAKATAAELKVLIEENKKTLNEIQRLRAEEIIKGKAEAGQIVQPVVETPQEYAKRIMGVR